MFYSVECDRSGKGRSVKRLRMQVSYFVLVFPLFVACLRAQTTISLVASTTQSAMVQPHAVATPAFIGDPSPTGGDVFGVVIQNPSVIIRSRNSIVKRLRRALPPVRVYLDWRSG